MPTTTFFVAFATLFATVGVADIAFIIDVMAGVNTPDESATAKADVNGDGAVDVADISSVIDIMAANARRAQ